MTTTTSKYVCAPPVEKVIPVTLGCDRIFSVRRTNAQGAPLNYAAGTSVYMWIDIDKANPTRVDAVITNETALFTLEVAVCDQVRTGTRWRVVLDLGETELPLLVGKFERHDG